LRAANVIDGALDLSDVKEMNFNPNEQRVFSLRPGDILVTEGSGSLGTVGASAIWHGELAGTICFQNTLLRVRPRSSQTDARFLAWWCRFAYADGLFAGAAVGANIFHLSAERARTLPVRCPPPSTQRAIADFLDAETARIDGLIAKKHRLIRLLEERWRSEVVTRCRNLMEARGQLPLKRFVQCLDGRRVPLSAEERHARSGAYPYYGASGQIDTIDDFLFDETLVLLGEDGAQLADPSYEISFVTRGKVWVNNHAHVLRPVGADADFLALHLSTFHRSAFISGSTREKITQDDMSRIPVPALSVEEQRREADVLGGVRRASRQAARMIQRQIALLQEHRQALVTAAVTGQLDLSATRKATSEVEGLGEVGEHGEVAGVEGGE
jgi:type I restriction enzyme S subunit